MNIANDYISVVGLRVIKCTHSNCVKFVCFLEMCTWFTNFAVPTLRHRVMRYVL